MSDELGGHPTRKVPKFQVPREARATDPPDAAHPPPPAPVDEEPLAAITRPPPPDATADRLPIEYTLEELEDGWGDGDGEREQDAEHPEEPKQAG